MTEVDGIFIQGTQRAAINAHEHFRLDIINTNEELK